ncbi:MAG: ABC transporter ATP-binding protein [Microcystaceae cyanobacterium]
MTHQKEVLIKVEHISKKFCKDLHTSLRYGIQDIADNIIARKTDRTLRPKEFWSVEDVSFEVKRGECLGLIGHNGAGKSTLLKMLNGTLKPDRGKIEMRGRVGALIELGAGFNPILTGRENIYANGLILGFTKKEVDQKMDRIIDFCEIEDFLETPVLNYSSGMRVKLGFAVAIAMDPDVLIIDEVLAVGDVGFRAKCFNAIHEVIKNAAVILVSHQMPQIARICTNVLVMNHGKMDYNSRDVPKGIDIFYSYFQGEAQGLTSGDDRATIHEVEIESNGVKNITELNYLDPLTVDLDLTIDHQIEYPSLEVSILTQELQHVAQCSSRANQVKIHNTGERMQVKVDLGAINLNPGIYTLQATVYSEEMGDVIAKLYNVKQFRLVGNYFSPAPVLLNGKWEVNQNVRI